MPAGHGPVLPAVVAGTVPAVVLLLGGVVEVALAGGAVVVVLGVVMVVLGAVLLVLALEDAVADVPLLGVMPVEGWIPGEGVMPPLLVSFGVVRAELGDTGVAVPVLALPVVVVAGAGTQSGVAAGVVDCDVLVWLVAEAGGIVDCGVAGCTSPLRGVVSLAGACVVEPGAMPGVGFEVVPVVEPGLCAKAIPVPSNNVDSKADVRVMLRLSY